MQKLSGWGMTDAVTLRPYLPQDAAELLRLQNLDREQPTPLTAFQEAEARWPAGQFRERWVAESGGRVVGAALLEHFAYIPPDHLLAHVMVEPAARGRGVGRQLADVLLERARTADVGGLTGNVRDDRPADLAWAKRRGFAPHAHRFASRLDLAGFDPAPHAEGVARVQASGVTFRDMTAASETDWTRLHDLYADLLTQTPDLAGQPRWSAEQVAKMVRDNPRAVPAWTLVAERGGEWLGLAVAVRISDGAYNELTGVVPAARGLGLARALKVQQIQRLQADGVLTLRTNNRSDNAPMLAVNQALGFVQQPGRYELRLDPS